jgi:NAD(P)H-hydrate epimerase
MRNKKYFGNSITSKEMRALEINSEYFGISLLQLMENAGSSIAQEIASRYSQKKKVAIFCGLGGNGGDGFVAARHLVGLGYKVSVFLFGKSKWINHKAAAKNWISLQTLNENIEIKQIFDSAISFQVDSDVIIDALLGTGSKGELRQPILQAVKHINSLNGIKIAIDIPTGIDADTGQLGNNAVKADMTITFHKLKQGLIQAKKYCGEIIVRQIGIPNELERIAGPGDLLLINDNRNSNAHKGDFGRLLVIGGSSIYSGAPVLASLGALKTGVDIVYTACPEKISLSNSSISPNLITLKLKGKNINLENIEILKSYLPKVDAVVIGPGLGTNQKTLDFFDIFIDEIEKSNLPLLLDADGIIAFSNMKRILKNPLIITPHTNEFKKLSERNLPQKINDRIIEVKNLAGELKAIIVLKGKVDIISDSVRTKLNFTGNPGMTVGGTGDVLSGIIGGLIAKKNDPFEAAVAGTFINGAAGDFAVDKFGYHIVATDLLKWIPHVFNNPMDLNRVKKSRG